jgi:copper chaperone CopZ
LDGCLDTKKGNRKQPKINKGKNTGMSCGGCVNSVKHLLLQIPNVEEAEVFLHPQSAIISMNKLIDIQELQTQLSKSGNYTINETVST